MVLGELLNILEHWFLSAKGANLYINEELKVGSLQDVLGKA